MTDITENKELAEFGASNTKSRCCSFSGHRAMPAGSFINVRKALEKAVEDAIADGIDTFIAGGALGFDMLCELMIIEKKKKHPETRLILILPSENYNARWNAENKKIMENIISAADKTIYCFPKYEKGVLLFRDRKMIDFSSKCICYKTQSNGGTAYTVAYAEQHEVQIINIAGR